MCCVSLALCSSAHYIILGTALVCNKLLHPLFRFLFMGLLHQLLFYVSLRLLSLRHVLESYF
ncbi:hypothetical protein V1511DRAFT_497471 [Dipodascopsis uninucleata]